MIDMEKQNKIALKYILNINNIKKQYGEITKKVSNISKDKFKYSQCSNNPIDFAEMENTRLWIQTINELEETLSIDQLKFLELRRKAVKQHVWNDYVQCEFSEWVYDKYNRDFVPNRRTLFSWQKDIVNIAVRIAISKKLL